MKQIIELCDMKRKVYGSNNFQLKMNYSIHQTNDGKQTPSSNKTTAD